MTYKFSRLEARIVEELDGRENVIKELVVGLTGTDDEGKSAYRDMLVSLPDPDDDTWVAFEDIYEEWAMEIAERTAEEQEWHESIRKELEARQDKPVPTPMSFQGQVEGPAE